ncbi:PADI1 deiminase, partial [Halcyon senegalensis]|nr:PADI1 deiminase [Halcyon senegalensis]
MAQQRRVQLSTQHPTSTVCVLGTELSLDVCGSAPKDAVAFQVQGTPGVKLYVVHETQSVKLPSSMGRWPLATDTEVLLTMDTISKDVGDEKVRISYFGEASGVPMGRAMLYLTCVGKWGEMGTPKLWHWWGHPPSSIPLPTEISLDADTSRSGAVSRTLLDKDTWTWGPDGHGAILLVNCDRDDPKAETPDNCDTAVRSYTDLKDMSQMVLRTRGPRTIFTGHRLVLHVDYSDADKVGVFYGGNSVALEEYKHVLGGSKLDYTVKPSRHQDESVFYVEGLAFPDVSFSGLGPDFGYVARKAPEGVSSLDSFGNLEVSPPVTAQGKEYPLGRILIGSSFPRFGGRRMAKAVKDFLLAQRVQAPVELFSDWLLVGHVDEFLSFVPAPDRKGFRLLLASPSACYQLLKEKQEEGFGEAAMFEGLEKEPKPTINKILANKCLWKFNNYVQSCINWNRDILKRALGLAEKDIIDIPQLFHGDVPEGAEAFFPNMVNMLVLGKHLGIPKPFGPPVGGQCCLEERVRALLEPLGLTCTFIDDFFSYHILAGEVHCGTNVRRKPFAFKWWHVVP